MEWPCFKQTLAFILLSTYLLCGSTCEAAPELLQPPGNGIPFLSKDKPVDKLNTAMYSALIDSSFIIRDKQGVEIKKNDSEKDYQSSYTLPSSTFHLYCSLSVEQGSIQVSAGNIKFVVLTDRIEIHQDGKLVKSFESKSFNGIAFERGYGLDNRVVTIARVYDDKVGMVLGADVVLSFPATIAVHIFPNTVGHIGPWLWKRGGQ